MKSQKDMTVGDEPPRSEGVQNVTGEEWRAITSSSRKNEAAETKRKQRSAVDVSGGKSKVWSCKEHYCTGTWNVSSMNQGKLDVVKQGMARVNIDILGISELKWTVMDKCSSDGHYIYYCGQESLRRNGVALIVKKKRVWNAVLGCNLKNNIMISDLFQSKPLNITVIQVYAPTTDAEVDWFYEDLKHLLDLHQKKYPFHHRGLECKSRKSINTWSNRKVWLWSTKWSRVET